uniref:Zgc:193593 n=1 Tax=Oncorhynchus mykiss TaxID=8022 RepID=A0A8K9VAZ1_ONCMY
MFFRLPRLTPGYIRYLQTQAVASETQRAGDQAMPRLAMFLGALGIGVCGYSSRQLALYHRPSARVLTWMDVGSTPVKGRAPSFMDLSQRHTVCQNIPPPSFAGQKVP